MYRILALCCSLGLVLARQPAAPSHDAEHLPDTAFSCRDKVLGGYYADPDAQCQMFHVCVKVAGVGIQDYRFLCPNGTAFDQEAQICAGWADVACEPAALYYSSDNFDLYRIGSGFESKKAPVASEEESDFHLQRAEPDILSGAHSSNFFNNREGKDVQDSQKNGGQNRNQVDQPQRKKIVKKLQRRPTETSFAPSTTQRQITNNYVAPFVSTTSRPPFASSSTQAPQNRENFNNQYNYQSFKQASTTLAPSDFEKISSYSSNDYKKTTPQTINYNRSYNQRHPSTPDYNNYNSESSSSFNIKQKTLNNEEFNKKAVSNPENRNYNTDTSNNYKSTRQPGRRYQERGQQTYRAQQTSTKVNFYSESTTAYYDKQFLSQNNANTQNSQQNTQYNLKQESTQKFNKYNGGDDRNNNQETTYQIKYNSPSTQQTTPKYQEFKNKNSQTQSTQGNTYNNEDSQYFDKIKSSPKYDEKITQFSTKQPTPQYNFENSNTKKDTNIPQTPPPKFNTNLLYDNNQQSTPDYYKTDNNREFKTNQPPPLANKQQYSDYNQYQQKSYSTPATPSFNQGISQSQKYQPQSNSQKNSPSPIPSFNQGASQTTKSYEYTENIQRLPTARSSSFNQGTTQSQTSYETKTTPNVQRISTAQPSYFNQGVSQSQKLTSNVQQNSTPGPATKRQEVKSTPAPFKSSNSDDYDDGQYRPELYERESGGEYDLTSRNNARKQVATHVSQNADVFKPTNQNIRKEVSPQISQNADVFKSARQNVRKEVPFQAPQESEYYKSVTQNARKEVPPQASQEVEFLKTAHSINIAASGNQLARERRPTPPSTTPAPFSQQQRVTTQSAPRTFQTTPSSQSVYANIAAVTSAAPRPFSVRPAQPSPQPAQQKKFVEPKKPTSSSSNSAPSQKAKDVSYDYAYYDNSEPYSEYENIEEFGRTSKKQ